MLIATSVGVFLTMLAAVSVAGYFVYVREAPSSAPSASTRRRGLSALADLGQRVRLGSDDGDELRKLLDSAGLRQEGAVEVFHGAKVAAMLGLPVVVLLLGLIAGGDLGSAAPPALMAGLLGWRAPEVYLRRRARRRRETIHRALPDFLDLLVIAVESGLALDAAVSDTARDLRRSHPDLAEELRLFRLEVQAGATRAEALRGLGRRCGEPELRKLVSLLIQADRFGSSIAKMLRAQSRYMRTRRRQAAEEKAHKVGVKMIFPIFLLIMPSVFLVTAGPAVLMLLTHFKRMAAGF